MALSAAFEHTPSTSLTGLRNDETTVPIYLAGTPRVHPFLLENFATN